MHESGDATKIDDTARVRPRRPYVLIQPVELVVNSCQNKSVNRLIKLKMGAAHVKQTAFREIFLPPPPFFSLYVSTGFSGTA